MKSTSLLLIFLTISLVSLSACKSPTAAGSGAPYVTISPANIHQQEFVIDTFQARIYNHDFAQTYFEWNFGDSTKLTSNKRPEDNFEAIHSFTKPGSYTVTVHAYDIYSKSIIATTGVPVIIDTAKSSVEIIPQFYNGIQTMNDFGLTPFSLSVKSLLPQSELYQFWDFGDGTGDSFLSGNISHVYPYPGQYSLKVDLYQKSGVYVGSDTAAITINFPDISLDSIKKMPKVEAYLLVDSSYSIFTDSKNSLPLSIGIPFLNSQGINSSWNGHDFNVEYKDTRSNFHISGTVSDDEKTVSSISINALDSSNTNSYYRYSFDATNLKLFAVTNTHIIYKVFGEALKSNMQNAFFLNKNRYAGSGYPDYWRTFIDNFGIPQCILVFSKQ